MGANSTAARESAQGKNGNDQGGPPRRSKGTTHGTSPKHEAVWHLGRGGNIQIQRRQNAKSSNLLGGALALAPQLELDLGSGEKLDVVLFGLSRRPVRFRFEVALGVGMCVVAVLDDEVFIDERKN